MTSAPKTQLMTPLGSLEQGQSRAQGTKPAKPQSLLKNSLQATPSLRGVGELKQFLANTTGSYAVSSWPVPNSSNNWCEAASGQGPRARSMNQLGGKLQLGCRPRRVVIACWGPPCEHGPRADLIRQAWATPLRAIGKGCQAFSPAPEGVLIATELNSRNSAPVFTGPYLGTRALGKAVAWRKAGHCLKCLGKCGTSKA